MQGAWVKQRDSQYLDHHTLCDCSNTFGAQRISVRMIWKWSLFLLEWCPVLQSRTMAQQEGTDQNFTSCEGLFVQGLLRGKGAAGHCHGPRM